jgi:hypothetical protein
MSEDNPHHDSHNSSEDSDSEKKSKIKTPNTLVFEILNEEEEKQITGLLLCKNSIRWKKYKNKDGWSQQRKSVAFSKGWRCWEMGSEMTINPISKNMDIFDIIQVRIAEIIRALKKKPWMENRIDKVPTYWIGHRYMSQNDAATSHIDSKVANSNYFVPIINICLGSPRRLIIENSETDETVASHLMKPGSAVFISEELAQKCKISLLSGSKKESDDSYHISLIGRFQTRY